jgi:hypothetical protein
MRPCPGRPSPRDHQVYSVVRPDDATATYQELSLEIARTAQLISRLAPNTGGHWFASRFLDHTRSQRMIVELTFFGPRKLRISKAPKPKANSRALSGSGTTSARPTISGALPLSSVA